MKILFQGDSITDAGRNREDDKFTGQGYATLVKAKLGFENPGEYEFINRGLGGNRIVDVYARIKKDIINLEPDIMSMLIGVNDVCSDFSESKNGVSAEKFEMIYDLMIGEIKQALPDIKIILLGAFTLSGCDEIRNEVKVRAKIAEKIAGKYGLVYVELQDGFEALCEKAEKQYRLYDSVHPTSAGHEYIKNKWLEGFARL